MKRHITVLIAVLLLAVAAAAAQQEPTETPVPPGAPDDVENVVDDDVALVDKSYANGEITLEFYSATSKTITMAGEPPAGSESGTGSISRERLRGNTTTVTIASGGGATFWTRDSMANGDYSYERKPSSGIVSGPWSARDVVLMGAMGAMGAMAVSTAVLYGAVLARLGEIEGGGRIA